jgi:hypothetical protein
MGDATGLSPALRACLLLVLGLTGLFFARRTGLEILPVNLSHPLRDSFLIGAAVGLYVLLVEAVAYRFVLPPEYFTYIASMGVVPRLIYFILRGFNEGIIYQLFLGSTLVWILGLAWRRPDGRIAAGAYWLGMTVAHLINIYINIDTPETATVLAYDVLRFVVPGVFWGLLFWRHGLTSVEIARSATHIVLQPLVGIVVS